MLTYVATVLVHTFDLGNKHVAGGEVDLALDIGISLVDAPAEVLLSVRDHAPVHSPYPVRTWDYIRERAHVDQGISDKGAKVRRKWK
jgi:hypothetical protein